MKSKAPLALMEQLIMVLVFALAAALCVQVFVLSDRMSRQNEARDRAVVEAQNAAETLKSCRGDYAAAARRLGGTWNGLLWGLSYDADWQVLGGGELWDTVSRPENRTAADGQAAYHLLVTPAESGQVLLGSAEIMIYTAGGELLYQLPVAWQEADGDA